MRGGEAGGEGGAGRADLDEVFGPEPVLLAPVQLRREREAAGVLLLEPLDARGLVTFRSAKIIYQKCSPAKKMFSFFNLRL